MLRSTRLRSVAALERREDFGKPFEQEIAELAAALPTEVRARRPEVDWRGWIGLRDLLVPDQLHREMFRLALCVEHDLPILLATVDAEINRTRS